MEWRCRICGGRVRKNYDHVGACDGVCHGTFEHLQPIDPTCPLSNRDVGHEDVAATKGPHA